MNPEKEKLLPRNPRPKEVGVKLGSGLKKSSPTPPSDDVEDAPEAIDARRPEYPDDVWDGTAYGEFADLCTRGNYVPKKFFSESIRTVVGAIVGDQLQCPTKDGVNARAYTVKIGPPGCGKGTSDQRVRELFCQERWEGLRRTERPMLWTSPAEIAWRSRGIGAMICNPASAPGLMKALAPRKLAKNETPNPMEEWKPLPRFITMQEELRGLFANFANESTGAGLESIICELFDRTDFTTTATKDRPPASGELMYSFLGGITREGWDSVFAKLESTGTGFLDRVNIVGTESTLTKSSIDRPDFTEFRNRFFPLINALEKSPRTLALTPSANELLDTWFTALVMPEGIGKGRLNVHAMRTGLHLAWLKGHAWIEAEDIEGGIRVANYQARMREFYAPAEGETRGAVAENSIRKHLRTKSRISKRDLRKKCHAERWDVGTFDRALEGLASNEELRIEGRTIIRLRLKD